ncbi:MAG: antirestriction protein ArdA [Gammaproteobacteria bacterium]|nr:antirestriction protein ArdA [Gammaproteobacteria bacterium]
MGNIEENPSIYVACLELYNNGRLYGVWIDVTLGVDHIWAEVNAMLKKNRMPFAEEWAIHDYQNFFSIHISESMDFEKVVEIAEFLKEHGKLGAALTEYYGGDVDDARLAIEENYHGEYRSKVEFAAQLIDAKLAKLPNYIRNYFDYESFAEDLFISDYLDIEVDGKIRVFSCL